MEAMKHLRNHKHFRVALFEYRLFSSVVLGLHSSAGLLGLSFSFLSMGILCPAVRERGMHQQSFHVYFPCARFNLVEK